MRLREQIRVMTLGILLITLSYSLLSGQEISHISTQQASTNKIINAEASGTSVYINQIHFGSTSDPLNGLTITWKSYGASDTIEWGYSDSYEMGKFPGVQRNAPAGSYFNYSFPSLKADSTIHYRIFDSLMLDWTEAKTYTCAPDTTGTKFSFIVMGDSQVDINTWHRVSDEANKHNTDFSLLVGDMTADGSIFSNWNSWFGYGREFLQKNLVYYTLGNHDCTGNGGSLYRSIFTMPMNPSNNEYYYSFTYKNAVFICLNSEEGTVGINPQKQYEWLLDVLQKNQDKTWKFVWLHRPFCATGYHGDEMLYKMDTWFQSFDDYGVDMIFSGHVHGYQRSVPVQKNRTIVAEYGSNPDQGRCQVVTGGAGGDLREIYPIAWLAKFAKIHNYCKLEIDSTTLKFSAYDEFSSKFDSLAIFKSNAVSARNVRDGAQIHLYPNPTKDRILIRGPVSDPIVFNLLGQDLSKKVKFTYRGKNQMEADLSKLPKGIYLLKSKATTLKLYKQ